MQERSTIAKVAGKVTQERLEKDMEKYRRMAIGFGAADAKIISSKDVLVDERTRFKCVTCGMYGKCAMCPPYTGTVEETRRTVEKYQAAVFILWRFSPEQFTTTDGRVSLLDARPMWNAMGKIESAAFYDGYYFAHGFGGGSCRLHLCGGADCVHPLIKPGGTCRFAVKSRPAMEGVGMGVFGMAANVGWGVYPIGQDCSPERVPAGSRMALVLVY